MNQLPVLYVRDDSTGERGEDAFRRATAEEIGTTVHALETKALKVLVGSIEIASRSDVPRGPGVFLIGQDCTILADGKPIAEWGRLRKATLTIEANKAVQVEILADPLPA